MSLLRRIADVLRHRMAPPDDERSIKAVQTEKLRTEVGAVLDRVDRITPPNHSRVASYARVRIGR